MWPATTATWLLDSGTIANTNYIGIPYNAANQLAALVVTNHLSSVSGMFTRRDPAGTSWSTAAKGWGAMVPYNTRSEAFTSGGWEVAFSYLESNQDTQTLSASALAARAMPELSSKYTIRMQYDWLRCVIDQDTTSAACL